MERQWYDVNKLIKEYEAEYYIIYGQRSNGKSYSVQKKCLDDYFRLGGQFAIVKRYKDDLKVNVASTMLDHLKDYVRDTYKQEIRFYQGKWLTQPLGETIPVTQQDVIGYAMPLSEVDRFKGAQYPLITNILFEEFMSMQTHKYLRDEVTLLSNLVSTISRTRSNVSVFLLGNSIAKTSPYSEALGFNLSDIESDSVVTRSISNGKGHTTRFVINRTKNVDNYDKDEKGHKKVYSLWNNSSGNMIIDGGFECGLYNRERYGCTFKSNVLESRVPLDSYQYLDDKKVPLGIYYVGKFYQGYYTKVNGNHIFGFKECTKQDYLETVRMSIGVQSNFSNTKMVNVISATSVRVSPKMLEWIRLLNACIKNNNVIFETDDIGQDVHSALAQTGIIAK